jgi:hypothetical protein
MISKTDKTRKFIVLEGLEAHNRFYSTNSQEDCKARHMTGCQCGNDQTKMHDGKVVYKILAYCDMGDEALAVIRGDGYNAMLSLAGKTSAVLP